MAGDVPAIFFMALLLIRNRFVGIRIDEGEALEVVVMPAAPKRTRPRGRLSLQQLGACSVLERR